MTCILKTRHPKYYTVMAYTKTCLIEMLEKQRPVVNQVTPVAQAIEIAKSEIERERKKEGGIKRKKAKTSQISAKRLKRYAYNPEDQV